MGKSVISFSHKGDLSKTTKFYLRMRELFKKKNIFEEYGQKGVDALRSATPIDSGKTADSWEYEVNIQNDSVVINWFNTNVNRGVNIAVILQYGHGTRNGGYVQGRDYINPAIKPVFDEMLEKLWKEVESA